jgi:TRAP transporter TAXI family solute receptor
VLFQSILCTADAKEELKWGSVSIYSDLHANTTSIADIVNDANKQKMTITLVATDSFADNLKRINKNTIQLGSVGIIEAATAYRGSGDFKNNPILGLRSLWGGYITPIHIITSKKSGITSIADLHKIPFAMNEETISGRLLKRFFKAQNIQPDYKTSTSIASGFKAMEAETVQGWYRTGYKDSAIQDLEEMMDINILPVTEEMMDKMNVSYPTITIPKGHYKALKKEQLSLAYVISDFTHKDLPEDTVFDIVKAIWEKRRLVNTNLALKNGRFLDMCQMAIDYNLAVPFHKGAVQFYQEKLATKVPSRLIPSDMEKPSQAAEGSQ